MPRRRQRAGPATHSPRSASASPELAIGHKEFDELHESVQGILARLEVLERVFVFVDLEQINDVLSKYSSGLELAGVPSGDKAGIDSVVATSKWESLPISRLQLIPEETGDSCDNVPCQGPTCSPLDCSALLGSGSHQSLQELSEAVAEDISRKVGRTVGRQDPAFESMQRSAETNAGPEISFESKHCVWEGPASAIDEDEQKSTCSTWDLCSTRDGLDMEGEIEPELFHQFMKQALRPKWEARVQSTGRSSDDDHTEHVDSGYAAAAPASTSCSLNCNSSAIRE